MTNEQTFIIDHLLSELLKLIMDDQNLTLQEALDTLYQSPLYDKIQDIETGLYLQSADYNYEILKSYLR